MHRNKEEKPWERNLEIHWQNAIATRKYMLNVQTFGLCYHHLCKFRFNIIICAQTMTLYWFLGRSGRGCGFSNKPERRYESLQLLDTYSTKKKKWNIEFRLWLNLHIIFKRSSLFAITLLNISKYFYGYLIYYYIFQTRS